ncbi:MAG: prephenate dehydrogenase/arogenate dehydrogenase family protein [Planctomycetota bacterium]
MPLFSRLAIIGVGLIGGSIGKAARERGVAGEVVGLVRSERSASRASAAGVVDSVTLDPVEACRGADFVLIGTPVRAIVETLGAVLPHLPNSAIITDAGSTKATVVGGAERLLAPSAAGHRFVGSHPLAGDHRTGPEAARADLLDGKTVVVTPTDATDDGALQQTTRFWEGLGARVASMPPGEHDSLVAQTSHLPHLVASLLANEIDDDALPFVASGWRDTTRVASGDPDLWIDILRENRGELQTAAERFRSRVDELVAGLANEDWKTLRGFLNRGKQRRDAAGEGFASGHG